MRLIIVGGVAGGASTAARARRLDDKAEIIMVERGDYVSFANCGLPYYVGGEIAERDKLLIVKADALRNAFGIDLRLRCEVKRILRDTHEVEIEDLSSGKTYRETYDKLVLAPGAAPVRPPLPGIDLDGIFTLRHIPDADAIKTYLEEHDATRAVVVGGGFIGIEMAENLRRLSLDVSLVELQEQVMAPIDPEMAALVHRELRLNGVKLRLGVSVASFSRDEAGLHVHLSNDSEIVCDTAILGIGVKPETTLAREAGLQIGERGGIVTDEHMATSDPDIYAAGDAVEVADFVGGENTLVPLGGPAARQGRIAADHICGRDSSYRSTQGTAIVRAFGLAIACTGSNEKTLVRRGTAFEKCYVHPHSHGSYYPGAVNMAMKLLFTPEDGKVLGAQIVGGDGVDKRIDVLAVALRAGLTVYDLEHLELAYAPQYGSAKDPVNMAGFVAANMLRGDVDVAHWDEVDALREKGAVFLDVRTDDEFEIDHIAEAVHIPIDELRRRRNELPKDRPIVAYCATGHRAYNACRALTQSGFADVKNLSGGWHTYAPTIEPDDTTEEEQAMPTPQKDTTPPDTPPKAAATLDACGLQCPGPIVELNKKTRELRPGDVIEVSATDTGFAKDLPAWCERTGFELLSLKRDGAKLVGLVRKPGEGARPAESSAPAAAQNDKTIVVFSNDMDRVMAAFIIANGAAAMGRRVTLFFTFWGLNVLRKKEAPAVEKGFMDRMFGWMMPKGPEKLKLSKMNMAGMGTAMMKRVMKQKNVQSLPELIALAQEQGVQLVACTMSMDVMGIKREELIDGIEEGGVATYLANAETADVNLFI